MKNSDRTKKIQEKETLRSNIRSHILQGIMDGTFKAGERIVETRLAKELDVSQAPVREAILELSVMGLLEEKPYSGTFVRAITAEDLEDIFHCRAIIEEYSVREATRKITASQLQVLTSLLDEMEKCDNISYLTDLDKRFHEAIMDAAGSAAMKKLWLSLHITEWTYVSASSSALSIDEIVSQHRNIYNYISAGDARSAGAYMFLHIKHFGNELVQLYLNDNDLSGQSVT